MDDVLQQGQKAAIPRSLRISIVPEHRGGLCELLEVCMVVPVNEVTGLRTYQFRRIEIVGGSNPQRLVFASEHTAPDSAVSLFGRIRDETFPWFTLPVLLWPAEMHGE